MENAVGKKVHVLRQLRVLLCRYEDLSSNPQHPWKKLIVVAANVCIENRNEVLLGAFLLQS